MAEQERCGAKTRKGTPCRQFALQNGRCKMHGGTQSGPRDRLVRPAKSLARGLYSDVLFPWEEDVYAACAIGTLEQELKLLRVQLRRALLAQRNYEIVMESLGEFREDPEAADIPPELLKLLEFQDYEFKIEQEEQEKQVKKFLRRKRDYQSEIARWASLIAKVEIAHKDLLKSDMFGVDTMERMAEDLRMFSSAAVATTMKPSRN